MPNDNPDKEWLSRKEAAVFLQLHGCPITPNTLANLAANNNAGKGPAFTKYRAKFVRYKRDSLLDWARLQITAVA